MSPSTSTPAADVSPAMPRRRPRPGQPLLLVVATLWMCSVCSAGGKAAPASSGGRGWFGGGAKVVETANRRIAPAASATPSTSTTTHTALVFWRKKAPDNEKKGKETSSSNGSKPSSSSVPSPAAAANSSTRASSSSSVRWEWNQPWSWVGNLVDEWQYRVESLDSYRKVVQGRMDATLERFQGRYEEVSRELRKDVDKQLAKASAVHEEYMERIAQQQQRLAELTRSELRIRQQGFNQSLEQFKRQYDETWGRFSGTVRKLGPFTKAEVAEQQRRADEAFQQFMAQYSNSTAEVRSYIDRMMRFSGDVFPQLSLADEHALGMVRRLREEEMAELARLGKAQLRSERARLEGVVEKLREQQERMMRQWSVQKGEMDHTLKRLLEQLLSFNRLYDDLIARKESNLYADSLNDKVLRRALECLDQGEAEGWEFVTETKGVKVHRKSMPSMDGRVSKYCCVKASGVLAASPADILTLFEDNTRVAEYNKFYAEGRDLEAINDRTKVVWAASPPMFFFKPRDFCTVVHYRKLQDGTVVVVNRAVEHPDAPRTDKYVRAEILMGANIIQPVPGKPNQAIFTIVTQVDPGIAFAPPAIVNKVVSWGPPTFFKEIEAAAQKIYRGPAVAAAAVGLSAAGGGAAAGKGKGKAAAPAAMTGGGAPAATNVAEPAVPAAAAAARGGGGGGGAAAAPSKRSSSSRPPPLLPSEMKGKWWR